jgi:G3E family GTPase
MRCERRTRRGVPARIPVTIVGGFLGSGKTTRVNALLREPRGRRIAVVLNEVGEVGIDGARLAAAEEFVELDGGCICCALNADLEATLGRLRARGGFDHLVVETTGIADPLPVAWTFERPGLREGYRVDAVATIVARSTWDACWPRRRKPPSRSSAPTCCSRASSISWREVSTRSSRSCAP